jgi:serine/threonine-protein kinase 24/25/MST4
MSEQGGGEATISASITEESGLSREKDTKYYEETLKEMSSAGEDDEWVFDTVKPSSSIRMPIVTKHTVKRRKLERIPSGDGSDIEQATNAMEDMSLDSAPLGDITNSNTPTKNLSTIRTPKPRLSSQRRVSAATARKVSVSSPTARRVSRQVSGHAHTARRVSARPTKHPLGVDMSFGNSTSTVRQFKRVSSGPKLPPADQQASSPQDSVFDSDCENQPPPHPLQLPQAAVPATTKEAILGRRCFAKTIDPAFQESYAATGDRTKREALSKVAEAWAELDETDPEGELILLRAILDRIQMDPKLASVLLPQRVVNAQLASLRMSSPAKKSSMASASTSSGITLVNSTSTTIAEDALGRDVTPQSSPSKAKRHSELPSSPLKSPGKLVLNPQNPHLKKMRSNQQLQAERERVALEEKMPGKVESGMEHVGMLADVLYNRWTDGLRARWPLA